MKTRAITKAKKTPSIGEVENSVLQGQTSIYMNQEDQQIKEVSEICKETLGFTGTDQEWKSLRDMSVCLEDSLLNQGSSSEDLYKQVEK